MFLFWNMALWLWEGMLYFSVFSISHERSVWLRDWAPHCVIVSVLISHLLLEEPSRVETLRACLHRCTLLSHLLWRHVCANAPQLPRILEEQCVLTTLTVQQNFIVLWASDRELFRPNWIQQQDSMTHNLQRQEKLWKEKIKLKGPTTDNSRKLSL